MDKTALSIAGAFTMTAAAAVTAMFLTVAAGAESSNPTPAAVPVRYEVIEIPVDTTAAGATTVHEIEYVTAPVPPESALAPMAEEYDEDDHDDEDDHEYEEDDDD